MKILIQKSVPGARSCRPHPGQYVCVYDPAATTGSRAAVRLIRGCDVYVASDQDAPEQYDDCHYGMACAASPRTELLGDGESLQGLLNRLHTEDQP